ncbi:MAG TPA: IS5 family transposase [Bacteroidales bacterium]|nr:IS5 family transposase [Bacteroidales bacterium]
MAKAQKYRASKHPYISPNQLDLVGFESPFSQSLDANNRWVVLAGKIPWDLLVSTYQQQLNNGHMGADGINPRVAIGAMILKHLCNTSDRETVLQIQENIYMQYFIGYSSFSTDPPFDPSLFVEFRKRLGIEQINQINEKILGLSHAQENKPLSSTDKSDDNGNAPPRLDPASEESPPADEIPHQGQLITDATACPQDIAYPTDLNLLNDAREKSEELIDLIYDPELHHKKPRTYRKIARTDYLHTAQLKLKSKRQIHRAVKKQLAYLRRNLKSLNWLLDQYTDGFPLGGKEHKYLLVITALYDQQFQMFKEGSHQVDHRIVSIHQPHVRPIVRGKTNAYVEFGAKINVSLMNGFAFLDDFSWDAFNEGTRLMSTIEKYRARFGYYPETVLADKIYCNRANRAALKLLGIQLRAKPLGRPSAVDVEHVRPGERNPIEGTFGQAKTAYGLNRIKARLAQTSESWIATIILVLNLVKLIGSGTYALIFSLVTFSASWLAEFIGKVSGQDIFHEKFELKVC